MIVVMIVNEQLQNSEEKNQSNAIVLQWLSCAYLIQTMKKLAGFDDEAMCLVPCL